MTEYEYRTKRFSPSGANRDLSETVELPEGAIGVSLGTWGDPESKHDESAFVTVRYLVPTGEADDAE